MSKFFHDIRYAWRVLGKNPGFAAVAILTLALGIGANSAIFSLVHAVLLEPLPFPHADRLIMVWETDPNRQVTRGVVAPAELLDWQKQARSFENLAGWQTWFYNIAGGNEPEQVWGAAVTSNFFDVFGIQPALGRAFQADEGVPGHGEVVIISHALWTRRFDGHADALGRSLEIDGKAYTIIGVMPAGFSVFGTSRPYDVWIPFAWNRAELRRDAHSVIVFGGLKPGISVAQAGAEMRTLLRRQQQEYPDEDQGLGIRVTPMREDIIGGLRPALLVLMCAVGFVLLIACANVANLLLARAATRQREIAVRAVLGAGRMRIFRQLLTESLLLGLLGGVAGVLVALGGLRLLLAMLPRSGGYGEIPHPEWIGVNGPVLLFTLGIALLTGLIFGLAPALQISRINLSESMKEGGRGTTMRRARAVRSGLVVLEVALSLILLVGAGLLMESFVRLLHEDVGFRPENLLTMQVWLPPSRYPSEEQVTSFLQQAIEQLRALPGVREATAINFLPMTRWGAFFDFSIEGRPAPPKGQEFSAQYRVIVPNYFSTMGIPLKEGRAFTSSDGPQSEGVVIVNQSLARQYWPDEDPIGKRIRLDLPAQPGPWQPQARTDWLTVVGLVGDVHEWELGERTQAQIYLSSLQNPSRIMRLVIRTEKDPAAFAGDARRTIMAINADQSATEMKTMDEYLSEALSQRRLNMSLLAVFAGLAVFLATVGIYGVVAYSVTQRSHEIGIRMALGAQPKAVLRLILGQSMLLTLAGIAIGLGASFFLTKLIASMLFGVTAHDPFIFGGVSLLLGIVALLASFIPARRAMRVDPLNSLRYE